MKLHFHSLRSFSAALFVFLATAARAGVVATHLLARSVLGLDRPDELAEMFVGGFFVPGFSLIEGLGFSFRGWKSIFKTDDLFRDEFSVEETDDELIEIGLDVGIQRDHLLEARLQDFLSSSTVRN